jgi:hypothetical protein
VLGRVKVLFNGIPGAITAVTPSLVSYKMSLEGGRFLIQDEPGGANPHAGT